MQPAGAAALDPEIAWVETARPDGRRSRLGFLSGLGGAGRKADVLRIGIDEVGVTFVRSSGTVQVRWPELVPARSQLGHGLLVLAAREGPIAPKGGPWIVDRDQAVAILQHPSWTDRPFAATALHAWLA